MSALTGNLGVACSRCGNSRDPLGVMEDNTGALVCFWCKAPDSPAAPALMFDPWERHATNGDFIELTCPDCAETIRARYKMIAGEYWGYKTQDGAIELSPVSFPHSYESDTPVSCCDCGVWLNWGLTSEGAEYIRETLPADIWHLWGLEE